MCDWIHCNKCFLKFRPQIKFYITTCGHLQCDICVSKTTDSQNHCLVCSSVCEMTQLSNDLNPDVLCFFKPAEEAIDKADQVCEFQLTNTLSLLKATTAKHSIVKKELAKSYKEFQEAKRHQHRLKSLLKASMMTRPGAGSTSMMSGNTSISISPSSATTSSFLRDPTSNPRSTPWSHQQQNGSRMMMHRQYPSASMMSRSTSTSITPSSTASSVFLRPPRSNPRSTLNQQQNAARVMMRRQYPGGIPDFSCPSDSSYSVSQEYSGAPFNLSGSPNESRNSFTRGSSRSSNHRMGGSGNKPR